jgi:hypothetical protein
MDNDEFRQDDEQRMHKKFEEKMDKAADRFSKTISEGMRRMEESFEQSKKNLKESGSITEKYKHIFNYPTGGFLLVVVGFVWLMYAVGFFKLWPFPIILIIIGLYMMLKKRSA